jgi:HEAT repeat protein
MSLFGWPKPKCPVGLREKAWIEMRLRWLGEQFGVERLARGEVILPTEQYFPADFDQTPAAARALLDRVCSFMGVGPTQVDLVVHRQEEMIGAAGVYEPGVIHLAEPHLADPTVLVTVLAHELTHHILFTRKLLGKDPDREWTTDLLAVTSGFGIFLANAAVQEKHYRMGRWNWWSVGRLGYMPSRMTGYALALLAWLRNESNPAWAGFLRQDAADAFRGGLHYLDRTDDSLLRPDNLHNYDRNPSIHRLLAQLEDGSGSQAVAALWELAQRGPVAGEAVEAVAHCLTDRRPAIRAEAARTLAELGPTGEAAIGPLVNAVYDREDEVGAAATYALGQLHAQPETVVPVLMDRLDDPRRRDTIETAAWALAQFGPAAVPALPRLLTVLRSQLGYCEGAIDYLVYAVRAISPDADAELQQVVASCDADLQRQAEHLLPDLGPIAVPPGGRGWWFWTDGPS